MRSSPAPAAAAVLALWLALAVPCGPARASDGVFGPRVLLPGTAAPAVARAQRVGEVPADRQVSVDVVLRPRDGAALERFLRDVGTHGTADYGHYLTPRQFTSRYGPTSVAVARVRAYLAAQGLRVTAVSANRQLISVLGSAGRIAEAFGTHERTYRESADRHVFFANDSALSLPREVAAEVQGVSGLSDHTVRAPRLARADPDAAAAPGPGRRPAPGQAPTGLSPAAYDGAYRLDKLNADGTGTTVALWEFDGYERADLEAYDRRFALSGPAVTTVAVDGADFDRAPGKGQNEVELDSEIVRGVAPKAAQLIYEAPNSDQGEIDVTARIVADNRAQVISMSWGSCEPDTTPALMTAVDDLLRQAAAQGISVFAASGDDGSHDCARSAGGAAPLAVDFPACDPYVTAVGGTTLHLNAGVWEAEAAWGGAGGGASTVFARPPWQIGTGVDGTMRTLPDVASNADPYTGFALYSRGSGGPRWELIAGTSAGAPLWAAFTALVNQKAAEAGKPALGQANPKLYALANSARYRTSLHDVTVGGNQDFKAGAGYDQVTGWGTPIADALAQSLLSGDTLTLDEPGDPGGVTGAHTVLQLHATDSSTGQNVTYSATGLPPGLSVAPATGLISGVPTTAGAYPATVHATDTIGSTTSTSFTWTITAALPVPIVDFTSTATAVTAGALALACAATAMFMGRRTSRPRPPS